MADNKDDVKENKLALPMKDLGKAILDEVKKQRYEEKKSNVIHIVKEIQESRDLAIMAKQRLQQEIDFADQRLAAIENGNFVVHEVTGWIQFTDNKLNRKTAHG